MDNISKKEDEKNLRLVEQFKSYTIAELKQRLYAEDGTIDPDNPLWMNYVIRRQKQLKREMQTHYQVQKPIK